MVWPERDLRYSSGAGKAQSPASTQRALLLIDREDEIGEVLGRTSIVLLVVV